MKFIKENFSEILICIPIAYCTFYRFENPGLTETQLFIELWWLVIPIILGFCLVERKYK